MNLEELRKEIDGIDDQIKLLFEKRMALVLNIAKFKEANDIPIRNTLRENEILARVTAKQSDELKEYTKLLFGTLFAVALQYQSRYLE